MRRLLPLFACVASLPVLGSTACAEPPPPEPDHCAHDVCRTVESRGWMHVKEGAELTFEDDPPSSGTHYPSWVPYQSYVDPVPRGQWLHNLEHGALVFLFRPDAPAEATAVLRDAYDALPDDPECGHKRALLTPDPDLTANVAVVAAQSVIQGDALTQDEILEFARVCRNCGGEDVCLSGGTLIGPF